MSAVPPNFAASVLQSNLAQRQVSAVRDAERNQRAGADRQQAKAVDQAGSTVETTDDTTQIYTDAEGAGSQGRAFSPPDQQEADPDRSTEPDGDQGRIIDLSA
ncbi:MAG: hypothetical protein HY718_03085 [Planctomycetes bacterium]|nr:hypothetical protein [Planctomycetota bacterium]